MRRPRRTSRRRRVTVTKRLLQGLAGLLVIGGIWGVRHMGPGGLLGLGLPPASRTLSEPAPTGGHTPHRHRPPAAGRGSAHARLKPKTGRTPPTQTATAPATSLPAAVLLRIPAQDQFPTLPNGCEVTSLSMLLGAVGHPVSKLRLAALMPKDPTPRVMGPSGQIVSWGNPNVGFVGSVYVQAKGFGIYHGPMLHLLDAVLPGRAVNLTDKPFSAILAQVARGTPVEIWSTIPLSPNVPWVTWQSPEGPVRTTLDEHAILIVGYGPHTIYINNPYNGEAAQAVPRAQLIGSWRVMGRQALTVRHLKVPPANRCVGPDVTACRPVRA